MFPPPPPPSRPPHPPPPPPPAEEEEEEERGEEEVEKVRFCFCGQYEGDFIVRCSDCGRWCHETCAAEEEVTLAHPLTLTYPKPEPEPEPEP